MDKCEFKKFFSSVFLRIFCVCGYVLSIIKMGKNATEDERVNIMSK